MTTQLIIGKQPSPDYGILIGVPGVGKTSFLAGWFDQINNIHYKGAPNCVLLGPENLNEANCAKFPKAETYDQLTAQINEILNGEHDDKRFQTVGLDSLDMIEKLIHQKICLKAKVNNIDSFNYGAGRKQTIADLIELEKLVYRMVTEKGLSVWYIAHCVPVDVNDPVLGLSYQNYELALHKSKKMDASKNFVDKVSTILFANHILVKTDDGYAKSTERRGLFTEFRPGHLAKNRYGLPYELPLFYEQYEYGKKLFYSGGVSEADLNKSNEAESERIKIEITNLIVDNKTINQETVSIISKSVFMAGNNINELNRILNKITTMVQ